MRDIALARFLWEVEFTDQGVTVPLMVEGFSIRVQTDELAAECWDVHGLHVRSGVPSLLIKLLQNAVNELRLYEHHGSILVLGDLDSWVILQGSFIFHVKDSLHVLDTFVNVGIACLVNDDAIISAH